MRGWAQHETETGESEMNESQKKALAMIVAAVVDAVKAAGPSGAPGGVLYAALMAQGCTMSQFESLMGALVRAGKLTQSGHLYFVGGSSK
jgi:hypothetical protein